MTSPLFSNQGAPPTLPNGHAGPPLPSFTGHHVNRVQAEVHSLAYHSPSEPQLLSVRKISTDTDTAGSMRTTEREQTQTNPPPHDSKLVSREPELEPEPTVTEPEVGLQQWPDRHTGILSSHRDPHDLDWNGVGGNGGGGGGTGGGGSRLKNRMGSRGGGGVPYMPAIAESELGPEVGVGTPASGASLSNNSSFSATYSNYVMSSTGSGMSGTPGEGKAAPGKSALTVEGTWKVETAIKAKQNSGRSGVKVMAVAKWVCTALMLLGLLSCLVAVKLSVLSLSHQLFQHLPEQGDEEATWQKYSAQFIVLYIYLSVPPFIMWLRAVWYGLLDKVVPWPCKRAIILTIVSAGTESLGLCLMCFSVLGRYQAPLSLLTLTMVLLVPAINLLPIVSSLRNRGRVRPVTFLLVMIGVVCLGVGIVGMVVVLMDTSGLDVDVWRLGAAFICLSVAWLPSLQRYICSATKTKSTDQEAPAKPTFTNDGSSNDGDDTMDKFNTTDSTAATMGTTATIGTMGSTATTTTNTTNTTSSNYNTINRRDPATSGKSKRRSGDLSTNAAWKTAFILNGCRILFIFLCSGLLFILDSGSSPSVVLSDQVHQAFLDAWDLSTYVESSSTWVAFWLGLGAGLLAYVLAFAACHMNMAKGALGPPLLLAMPVSLAVLMVQSVCTDLLPSSMCDRGDDSVQYLVPAACCLALGHALAFSWYLFRVDPVLLLQECMIFCTPGYNCVNLASWLTINRRHDVSVPLVADAKKKKQKARVYICTTMYREEEDEMRQLLESIRLINEAQAGGDRYFESHIIFDNGVRQKELSEFALTLIALLNETLGIKPKACTKVTTPYGLKLSWALPGPSGQRMAFNIHLKDNLLVKNKKRWSQVMYMSYVLDFLTEGNDDTFILTTDADVVFTPDSVEALLDLMTRDNSIGAVCARTHPMGGGPLVWYQVFEYAIGHWFQKTAEHVLGSVLCAPGCFSVYRCQALADVLPKYAKRVENAFDFLTKDMGEDRWLCTLLVQTGWRIEYCAASENSTNCPKDFDEFYKQRRRWIASTLANLMLIVKEWRYVHLLNHRVSVIFLAYQGLLLFSTLIGPSTVMLVVSGGLSYAWAVDGITTLVIQALLCVGFSALCVYTTQPTQLKVAKMYTFIYAVIMTAVVVGTAAQIVDDLGKPTAGDQGPSTSPTNGTSVTTTLPPNQHISVDLPMSVTTLYFLSLVVIFVTAGLLHPREVYCLVHGVWYMLCLPSGYLVLTIYSICNITDSSWGTREQAAEKSAVKKAPWQERLQTLFYEVFFCCNQKQRVWTSTMEVGVQTVLQRAPSVTLSVPEESPAPAGTGHDDVTGAVASQDLELSQEEVDEIPDETEPIPVEEWLPLEMRGRYTHLFEKHGFDSTLFIAGMTETELRRIGVTSKGHLHYLLAQIALIPAFEIEYKVPTNVDEWLEEIGLPMYRDNFRRNHIRHPKEMEILKSFGRKEIEKELGIVKDGHIKRMKYAISKLRDPTEAQQRAIRMRQLIDDAPMHNLAEFNVGENDFWETLKTKCLEPDLKAFGLEGEVKVKLAHLRNDWLMIVAVSNTLWLILISTLAANGDLTVLGANPLGLVFLTVFGFLFAVQFLTMLLHRFYTLSHFLARAPYKCGRPMNSTWTFLASGPVRQDFEDTYDYAAVQQVKRDAQRAWDKVVKPKRKAKKIRSGRGEHSLGDQPSETTPLL